MAVTNIPNVQNWTVTPQNGQSGYFDLMNTWLGQSTLVIASLQSAITAQNAANIEINNLASQVSQDTNTTVTAKDEAVTALALLEDGSINDTTIGTNKAYSNSKVNELLSDYQVTNKKYVDDGLVLKANISEFINSKVENGYQKLQGGLIIQWGKPTVANNTIVTFPLTFPNAALSISMSDSTEGIIWKQGAKSMTTTGFTFISESSTLDGFYYIAIGY